MANSYMHHLQIGDTNFELQDKKSREDLIEVRDDVEDLKASLKAGTEETADLHLGFYLDENGDLCQVDDDEEEE